MFRWFLKFISLQGMNVRILLHLYFSVRSVFLCVLALELRFMEKRAAHL